MSTYISFFEVARIGNIHILRDDLIAGGTKRRALSRLLPNIEAVDLAYAGTVMGHGALAFAHAARDCGKTAHVFVGANKDHPMFAKLEEAQAILHLLPPEPIQSLYRRALEWQSQNTTNRHTFPIGFDTPEFKVALQESLSTFDASPYSEIWTTCVSGTLTRALQAAFPSKPFHTVKVVKADTDFGEAAIYNAPEKYHQTAKEPPPYPACPYTDAKLWQFAQEHAAPDALIWNTAG